MVQAPTKDELDARVGLGLLDDDEPPRLRLTRRRLVLGVVFIAAAIAFLYWGVPQLAGLEDTWERINEGRPWWLILACVFAVLSFGGYILLFRHVFLSAGARIDLAASYQITMAGLAATRLFAAGGAGGIALQAWALRRSGMERREVADATVTFLAVTYAVYMLALVVCGVGLYTGVLSGDAPFAVTMVPAILGAVAIAAFLLMALVPTDLQRRLQGWAGGGGRLARAGQRLANAPAALSAGTRAAIDHVRSGDPALLGAIVFWGCNIGVLWACFHAFGDSPAFGVLIMGYFVGMLGNLLPLPGGVGGVDGGMIGAFVALGVDFGLATVAVLSYRAFAFYLPTIPGAIAYLQLRKTVARWRDEHQAEREAADRVPAPV